MNKKLFRHSAITSSVLFTTSALALLCASAANAANSYSGSVNLEKPFPLKTADQIHGQVDFGTKFKTVEQICVKPEFSSSHTWLLTLNAFDQNNNEIWDTFFNNNVESCEKIRSDELLQALKSGKLNIAAKPQTRRLKNLSITIIGEPEEVAGDTITLDAAKHTLSGFGGNYLSHQVDPNITYTIEVLKNDAVYNESGDKFTSVGVSYTDIAGNKKLAVAEGNPVYVTSEGELQFFLVDDAQGNNGEVNINIKRVNLD